MLSRIRRIHYAWAILLAVMLVNTVSLGIRLSFGVFVDPLAHDHGWSHGAISFAYTLQFLAGVPIVLVVGRLVDRIGSRAIMIAGAFFFALGMVLTATVTQAWQFQLYFGFLVGGLGSAAFTVMLPVLLTQWFNKKLGLALGLMWTSLSSGPLLFSPLMAWSIESAGWQRTFIVFGVGAGVVMLAASLLIKDRPADKGLTPYGGHPEPLAQQAGPLSSEASVPYPTLRQVLRTRSFWGLLGIHTLGCIGHTIPLALMVPIATFAGVPSMVAAGLVSALSLSSLVSRFGASLVSEARGGRFTLALAMVFQTVPSLLLLSTGGAWWFYAFAILFGIGYGAEMVGFPIFNRQYYSAGAPLGTIYAAQMAGALFGMGIGGWLGGIFFDATGSYMWTVLLSTGASFLALIFALALPGRRSAPEKVLHPVLTRQQSPR